MGDNNDITLASDTYKVCLSDLQRRLLTIITQELTDKQIETMSQLNRSYNELDNRGSNSQSAHSKVLHHLITHTLINHALLTKGPTNLITPDILSKRANLTEPELREIYTRIHELKNEVHSLIFGTEITRVSSTRIIR
jgi:hypothetical protein